MHIGVGFSPWIVNGLVLHTEDVMEGQARRGHQVGYFFAARQLPRLRRPLLHRWTRRGVTMFEWMNSSVVVGRNRGTPDPDRDLHDPRTEAAFARVLRNFRPEIVHVQDLGGLPSSLLGAAQDRGLPVVVTLHDYQALCPTIKLYDAHGQNCLRARPGEMCVVCCANAPRDNLDDVRRTMLYERTRLRGGLPYLDAALQRPAIRSISDVGLRLAERFSGLRSGSGEPSRSDDRGGPDAARAGAAAYDRRRENNVERLNRADALITPSVGAGEVWRRLGVRGARMHTLSISPSHVERLHPEARTRPGEPICFAVLNGASSTEKGADLLADALSELTRRGLAKRFRLAIHGLVAPHVFPRLAAHPAVEIAGEYQTGQLDHLLEDVDVGVMPSVWQEVYGFGGIEFLAKGIPVIGNARGGIPEYVRPGRTGWLNQSCSASELADLMERTIENPDEVERLGRSVVELRESLIRPFDDQLADLEHIYRGVIHAPARMPLPERAPPGSGS